MDITCPQCKTEYEFEDDKITVEGITVKCTNCDYIFKLRRKAVVEAEAVPSPQPEAKPPNNKPWMIRAASGDVFTFKELTTLQQWIVERKVGREDQISRSGETWKRLGDIAELSSFFQVVDAATAAQSAAAQNSLSPLPQPSPAPSGTITPTPTPPIVQDEPAFSSDMGQFRQVGPSAAWETGGDRLQSSWEGEYYDEIPRRRTGRTIGLVFLILILGAGGAFAYIMRDRIKTFLPGSFMQNGNVKNNEFYQAGRKLFLQDDEKSLQSADLQFVKAPNESALVKASRAEVYTTWAQHLRSAAVILERKANLIDAVKHKAEETPPNTDKPNKRISKHRARSRGKKATPRTSASTQKPQGPEGDPKLLRINASRLRDEATKKMIQAEVYASAALKLGGELGEVHRAMADYLRLMDQSQNDIEKHLLEAQKQLPDDPETLYIQGALFANIGKPEQAEEFLNQSLAKTKARYGKILMRAAFLLAMELLKNNQLDLARAQTEAILKENPDHNWAKALLEEIDEEKKYPQALASLGNSTEAPQQTEEKQAAATPSTPQTEPMAATAGGSKPSETKPHSSSPASHSEARSYDSLIRQGNALSERGHTGKAFKIFELALKIKPSSPEALTGLGYCHLDQERFATAMSYFKRALAVSQIHGEALIGMAEAYKMQGNLPKARDYYSTYLRAHPNSSKSVMAQRNIVEIERKLGTSSPPPAPSPGASSPTTSPEASSPTPAPNSETSPPAVQPAPEPSPTSPPEIPDRPVPGVP